MKFRDGYGVMEVKEEVEAGLRECVVCDYARVAEVEVYGGECEGSQRLSNALHT